MEDLKLIDKDYRQDAVNVTDIKVLNKKEDYDTWCLGDV